MDHRTWSDVDAYVSGLSPEDEALMAANRAAAEAGLPAIQVSAPQGKLLQLLAQVHGAQRALEVGTLAGYSAIWLARGLTGDQPHLTTLEIDPAHADVARANIARAGLSDVVEVVLGAATDSLRRLVEDGTEPFDLVFIDADKPGNVTYLEWALRLTRPGAVIVVDNVVRAGAVADPASRDDRVLGSRAVIDRVAGDTDLSGTVIQTVGTKGYDGFLLVRRTA